MGDMAKGIKSFKRGMTDEEKKEETNIEKKTDEDKIIIMFSFGWSEIALTLVVVVIVVGPKEIPNLLRQIGSFSKSIKKISREFKKSLNEIAEEGDLKDIKKSISEVKDLSKDIDPTKEIKKY